MGSQWFNPLHPNVCCHTASWNPLLLLSIYSNKPSLSLFWRQDHPKRALPIFSIKVVFLKHIKHHYKMKLNGNNTRAQHTGRLSTILCNYVELHVYVCTGTWCKTDFSPCVMVWKAGLVLPWGSPPASVFPALLLFKPDPLTLSFWRSLWFCACLWDSTFQTLLPSGR